LLRKLTRALPRALRHVLYLAKRRKEAFELLSARTIEGLIFCDGSKRIQYLNGAARQLLNLPVAQKLIGEPLSKLNVSYLNDFIDEARREGLLELNKVFTVMDKPSMLVGAHIELLKNSRNQKVGWMIDLRDVSQNWQNHQLRSALTLASHEMKTPLYSIKSSVELLLETSLGELNDQQKRCLHLVKDDVVRLNRLLSDILDLSRFDAGIPFLDRRREISLPILIDKAIESFQAFAQSKNIKIENQVSPAFPIFNGQRDRLQQVVANLLENGVKYTLPGGSVTLQAELIDKHLIFTVKDTGVGIPASERERIFQRFQQLDNYPGGKQGFGLGLSISKEIIEAMGGRIWVESQVGVGSSFHFKIPV
jgi:signal transduction histidine kinase